jgi:hypothetical protein
MSADLGEVQNMEQSLTDSTAANREGRVMNIIVEFETNGTPGQRQAARTARMLLQQYRDLDGATVALRQYFQNARITGQVAGTRRRRYRRHRKSTHRRRRV